MHAAASDPAPVYGQMANSSRIYAYSPKPRSFEKSVAYCESLWMQPVSIHSEAENEAVAQLIDDDDVEVYIGGKPACANDALTAAADYRWTWTDDSAFDFQGQWAPQYPGSNGALFIVRLPYIGARCGDRAANDGALAGVVCAAPSPADDRAPRGPGRSRYDERPRDAHEVHTKVKHKPRACNQYMYATSDGLLF